MAERTVQISMIAVILFAIGLKPASVSAEPPRKSKFAPTRTGPTFLWFPNGPVLIIPPWITLQKTGPLVSLTNLPIPFERNESSPDTQPKWVARSTKPSAPAQPLQR